MTEQPSMSAETYQALAELKRQRLDGIDAELARLQQEREGIAQWLAENDPAAIIEHRTTVEPTTGGPLPVPSARWYCSCGAAGDYDYLQPPTAERLAREHVRDARGGAR